MISKLTQQREEVLSKVYQQLHNSALAIRMVPKATTEGKARSTLEQRKNIKLPNAKELYTI